MYLFNWVNDLVRIFRIIGNVNKFYGLILFLVI